MHPQLAGFLTVYFRVQRFTLSDVVASARFLHATILRPLVHRGGMPKGGASARAIAAHAGRARRTTDGFVSDVRRSRPSEGSEGARRRVLAWHRRRSRASGVQRRLLLQPRGVARAGGRWNAAAMSAPTAAVSAGASTLPRAGAPARPRAVSVDLARASVAARVAPRARAWRIAPRRGGGGQRSAESHGKRHQRRQRNAFGRAGLLGWRLLHEGTRGG